MPERKKYHMQITQDGITVNNKALHGAITPTASHVVLPGTIFRHSNVDTPQRDIDLHLVVLTFVVDTIDVDDDVADRVTHSCITSDDTTISVENPYYDPRTGCHSTSPSGKACTTHNGHTGDHRCSYDGETYETWPDSPADETPVESKAVAVTDA